MPSRTRHLAARIDRESALQEQLQTQLLKRLVPGHEAFAQSALEKLEAYCQLEKDKEGASEESSDRDDDAEVEPLLIGAPACTGKSSLAAYWADRLQCEVDTQVLRDHEQSHASSASENLQQEYIRAIFVGSSFSSQRLSLLLQTMTMELIDAFQLPAKQIFPDEDDTIEEFGNTLKQASRRARRIVLIIDGIEKLELEDGGPAALKWLPDALPENVRIVLFAQVNDPKPFTHRGKGISSSAIIEEEEEEEEEEEDKGDNEADNEDKREIKEEKNKAPNSGEEDLESPAQGSGGDLASFSDENNFNDLNESGDESAEASLASDARNRSIEFMHFTNHITEQRAKEIIVAFIKWTAQLALEKNAPSPRLASGQSSSEENPNGIVHDDIASTPQRALALLQIHTDQLAGFAARWKTVSSLFLCLRGIHFAAQLNYDVNELIRKLGETTHSGTHTDASAVIETLMHFFARGNYPTRISVTAAWEAAQSSSLISERSRPSSGVKRPLPSPRELAQYQVLCSILTTGEGILENQESKESNSQDDDEYSDEEFEEYEAPKKSIESEESQKILKEMQAFPVYLLGGSKWEPLGDWLYKSLGYIASARYGLTLDELNAVLDEACRKDIEMQEESNKPLQDPVLKMADDSLEDWLLNETMPDSPSSAPPVVPESVKAQLQQVLPCFACKVVGDIFAIMPENKSTHTAVMRVVLASADYAPTESHVERMHANLEYHLYGKLKAEIEEEMTLEKSLNTETTDARKSKKRPCEEDYSRRDTYVWEMGNLPARWRLVLLQVLSAQSKSTSNILLQRYYEEYPWLLASNGRWVGLLGTIADLQAFRIMWNGTRVMRSDLHKYWLQLSSSTTSARNEELVSDTVFAEANDNLTGLSQSFPGLSNNGAHRVPPMGPGEETPLPTTCWLKCDPVEHYTRAVEIEQGRSHVSLEKVRALANATMEICEFLYMFGQDEVSAPEYLHPPLRESRLAGISLELPHGGGTTLEEEARNNHFNRHGWTLDVEATTVKLSVAMAKREEMMNEQHLAQRTQAVSKVDDEEAKHKLLSLQRKQSQFFLLRIDQHARFLAQIQEERAAEGNRFRGNRYGENFYSYQRWVWIHFPWMALYQAYQALANAGGPQDIEAPTVAADVFWLRKKKDPKSDRPPPPKRLTTAKIVLPASLTQSAPSLPSLGSPTTSLGPLSPKALGKFKGDPSLLCQGVGPSHRDAHRLPANEVPYSSPSVRTIRHGTRFPTFEMMQRERPSTDQMSFFNGGFVDPEVIKAAQEGRQLRAAKSKPDQRDSSVLAQMTAHLPAHLRSYPTTEQEARVAELNGMISDFRRGLDELHFEANRKEDELESLMQQVYERIELDRFTEACIRDGEQTIALLTDQLTRTNHGVAREEVVHGCLKRIVKVCEKYPAHDEKHVLQMEALLENMREDRLSLSKDLDEVELFIRRATEEDKPIMEEALDQRRERHNEILNKLFQWRENERRNRRMKAQREANRRAIINSTKQEPLTFEMTQRRWNEAYRQKLVEEVFTGDLDEEQHTYALAMKRHRAFRKLRKLAGSSEVSEICLKFNDSQQKFQDLTQRRREAFRRIKHLKERLEILQKDKQCICKRKASKSVTIGLKIEELSKSCETAEERLRVARENHLTSDGLVEQIKINLGQYNRNSPQQDPHSEEFEDENENLSDKKAHERVEALLVSCASALGLKDFKTNLSKDAVQSKAREQQKLTKADLAKRRKFLFGTAPKKPVALPPRISVDVHRSMRKSVSNNNNPSLY